VHHQGVTFENLADWLERRLEGETLKRVEAHLAMGCPRCERDLAWLRRLGQAARTERTIPAAQPPAALVAQVRQSYRARAQRPVAAHRQWRFGSWRPALALAGTVVLLLALLMAWQPGIIVHSVVLASAEGVVQVRSGGADWQEATPGNRLVQGTRIRVSGGAAVVELFDGSRLQLESGAEVELSVLRSSLFGQPYRIGITQRDGYVIYDLVSSSSSRSAFTVNAPSASVATRGKVFAVSVEDDAATRVVVLEGEVAIGHDQAELFLSDREGMLISAQGALVLLPTLAAPSLDRPTATPPSPTATPVSVDAYPVASPTGLPATRTPTHERPSSTPAPTRTEMPKPAPSRTPRPYDVRRLTEWAYTVTPAMTLPVMPSSTPTCWMTTTCWPTATLWAMPTAWPTMPKMPTGMPTMPKMPTGMPTMPQVPTGMPTMPPEIKTAIPVVETMVFEVQTTIPVIETRVSEMPTPHAWPTSMPVPMPTWNKPQPVDGGLGAQ
jgi:hypothetical protein